MMDKHDDNIDSRKDIQKTTENRKSMMEIYEALTQEYLFPKKVLVPYPYTIIINDFAEGIEDIARMLNEFDETSKCLLDAAYSKTFMEDLCFYLDVLNECQKISSDRKSIPSSFVATISRKLRTHDRKFLALLDVKYDSDCSIEYGKDEKFIWKPKEEVAVMLPESIYGPYLRYKISEQIKSGFPWQIKMVSAANIEKWIVHGAVTRLMSFAGEIKSICNSFPKRHEITEFIEEAINSIHTSDFEEEALGYNVERSRFAYSPFAVRKIKDKLLKHVFKQIATRIANKVANKITEITLANVQSNLRRNYDIGYPRYHFFPEPLYQIIIVLIESTIAKSVLIVSVGLFGLAAARMAMAAVSATAAVVVSATAAVAATAVTLTYWLNPVDVNSRDWRQKMAIEAGNDFEKKRETIKNEICHNIIDEIEEKLTGSGSALITCSDRIRDLQARLEEQIHDYIEETFSKKDFEEMKEISSSARKYREERSCLESLGCVSLKDQFHCVIQGRQRRQKKGTSVVVALHEDNKEQRSTATDFPLVFITLQEGNSELEKIGVFKKEEGLQNIEKVTAKKIRAKIDTGDLHALAKSHSNLVAIDVCTTKSKYGGEDIQRCDCIVIFCFAKGFIPIGENMFPQTIKGIKTDVREGYALPFGTRDYNNPIGPGCSVGLKDRLTSGSIGFLLKHKKLHHFAFLSAAHVFFDVLTLRKYAEGHQHFQLHDFKVVQPSDQDRMQVEMDRTCGHVESIFFNRGNERGCKDIVVVKSKDTRHPRDSLQHPLVSDDSRLNSGCLHWPNGYDIQDFGTQEDSEQNTVVKVGRTTEITRGKCVGLMLMAKFKDTTNTPFELYNLLKIYGKRGPFSQAGDSGAGVYLKERRILKPLAIVEGSLSPDLTLAIPISEFKSICRDYDFQTFSSARDIHDDDDDDDDDDNEVI